ncbi:MAG: hypothetical protein KC620_08850 [Myxococcales bacterium]|nr:hypothetical protein [Myxococcales bacterium]
MTPPTATAAPSPGAGFVLDPFAVPDAHDERWAIDLPEAAEAATAMLDAIEKRTTAVEGAIADAPDRIGVAIERAARPTRTAFALDEDGAETPEDRLAAALRPRADRASFGIGDAISDEIRAIEARLEALIASVRRVAHVETRVAGRVVARSTLGWTGSACLVVDPEITPETADNHARTLALAVRVRQTRLRLALVVLTGAARSAALLAAGGLSALPAIYRFVRQVIDEVDAFNQAAETAEPIGETS